MRCAAPAKVNLTLRVGRPEANGRHPLASIVTFASVADVLTARESEGFEFTATGPYAAAMGPAESNLVAIAAHTVAEAVDMDPPRVALHLEKNLPVGAGLGGGSADAAAALRLLPQFWRRELDPEGVAAIAAALGADVPACLRSGPVYMTGTGERVSPIALAPLFGVLVFPGVGVSTGEVYRAFDALDLGKDFEAGAPPVWLTASEALAGLAADRNDLTFPAAALAPQITEAMELLRAGRALLTRMSGSGSAVFGLTETLRAARVLAAFVRNSRPDWWVAPVRLDRIDVEPLWA